MHSASISVADAVANGSGDEIVHSIFDYDVEYQERARAAVEELMYHRPQDSYVRWRPVRVVPREVLRDEILSDNAMPEALKITAFHDFAVSARKVRYTYFEHLGSAIWEGVIPGIENSRVEITIVDATDKLMKTEERIGFVIKVWHPPKHFYISPTEDLDVYVAIEGHVANDRNIREEPEADQINSIILRETFEEPLYAELVDGGLAPLLAVNETDRLLDGLVKCSKSDLNESSREETTVTTLRMGNQVIETYKTPCLEAFLAAVNEAKL
jgi:hypothetical protein